MQIIKINFRFIICKREHKIFEKLDTLLLFIISPFNSISNQSVSSIQNSKMKQTLADLASHSFRETQFINDKLIKHFYK
jgi:hypothetical protein